MEVLDDDVLARAGRPVRINFLFHNYTSGRHLSFCVTHGDSGYDNEVVVIASELPWLNDNFLSVRDAIDAVKPQSCWVKRHKTFVLYLIALGVGSSLGAFFSILFDALNLPISPLPPSSPWRSPRILAAVYLGIWFCRWFSGMWVAPEIRGWLFKLWPTIELDLGCEHLKLEKSRRERALFIMSVVVLPIAVTILCDIIRFSPLRFF
jgi:hypothetical protein